MALSREAIPIRAEILGFNLDGRRVDDAHAIAESLSNGFNGAISSGRQIIAFHGHARVIGVHMNHERDSLPAKVWDYTVGHSDEKRATVTVIPFRWQH